MREWGEFGDPKHWTRFKRKKKEKEREKTLFDEKKKILGEYSF